MKELNEQARIPPSFVKRLAAPPHAPGCDRIADVELWHGREDERVVAVREYRVHAQGLHIRARCVGDDLLRISDDRGRPVSVAHPLFQLCERLALDWKGPATLAALPFEVLEVERSPFSKRPALWQSVLVGVARLLALLYHAWDHETPLYSVKSGTLGARWLCADGQAAQLWRRLHQRLAAIQQQPQPWEWWTTFAQDGPYHGARSPMPVWSWTGTSIVRAIADRFPSHIALVQGRAMPKDATTMVS